VTGVAYKVEGQGYGGEIDLILAVDRGGTILGTRALSHSETPGLGDKIEASRSDWVLGFDGRSLSNPPPERWAVKKDGGIFDQFTGATITPRGVVRAIKGGLEPFRDHREALPASPAVPKAAPAGARTQLMREGKP
jgi:electron transport complex protein RnfG